MYKFVSFALIVSDSFELKKKQSMWSIILPQMVATDLFGTSSPRACWCAVASFGPFSYQDHPGGRKFLKNCAKLIKSSLSRP